MILIFTKQQYPFDEPTLLDRKAISNQQGSFEKLHLLHHQMKIALKHFLRIMLISIGIFAVVVGGQLIWYDLRFPKPPDHEQEIFSPLFQTYLAPLKLLPEQLMQSGTMAILILSLYTLILGAVVYLLISILALASNRITNRKSPEAS